MFLSSWFTNSLTLHKWQTFNQFFKSVTRSAHGLPQVAPGALNETERPCEVCEGPVASEATKCS